MTKYALPLGRTLIRVGFVALALAYPLSWAGFRVLGDLHLFQLAACSVAFYSLCLIATEKVLGVPSGSCPIGPVKKKLMLQAVASSFVQLLLAGLFPFVTITHWWTVLAGSLILLASVTVSNIPTKTLAIALDRSDAQPHDQPRDGNNERSER